MDFDRMMDWERICYYSGWICYCSGWMCRSEEECLEILDLPSVPPDQIVLVLVENVHVF